MTNDVAYLLGQIYGKIISINPHWSNPGIEQQVLLHPMNSITEIYLKAMKSHSIDPQTEKYISLRFDEIDAEEAMESATTAELKSAIAIGINSGKNPRTAKELIARINLNQGEIAQRLGINPNTIGRWANGKTPLSEENRFKLEQLRRIVEKEKNK